MGAGHCPPVAQMRIVPMWLVMPLHLTKIAYGADSLEEFWSWFQSREEVKLTTRYLPRRHEEMQGGSLYWIFDHMIVARSPITEFSRAKDGRWHIHLACPVIPVIPKPKRAHQGWRYLEHDSAPNDIGSEASSEVPLPPSLARELGKIGLI